MSWASPKFILEGGHPLQGEVEIHGSKNAASKLLVASLLTDEPCTIENVPFSAEMDITRELCESIGSSISFGPDHTLVVKTPVVVNPLVTQLSRKNRIPILALGPLLHRRGIAEIPVLGGCPIGHRPVNFHLEALNKMGATIERRASSYYAYTTGLRGAEVGFAFPSVGATENVLLAGVLAQGETVIRNAALEPEILNLIQMLRAMGADIALDESSRQIRINGVKKLKGVKMRVMPDRNEVVSLATAALATGGDIMINNIESSYLKSFLEKVKDIGANFEIKSGGIRFWGAPPYRATFIETAPHPGFMTDWQQPFCVLLTKARGVSIIHETVYEDRFGYTKDLKKMGADIEISDECPAPPCRFHGQTFNHVAHIKGPANLYGTGIVITDIRAGMAHMVAALAAQGRSIISGVEHIDRGYEKIDERLCALGANILRT